MISFNITTFTDPTGNYAAVRAATDTLLSSIASYLNNSIESKTAVLDVALVIESSTSDVLAKGAVGSMAYTPTGSLVTLQTPCQSEILTGVDQNGSADDLRITLSTKCADGILDPAKALTFDPYDVMIHEVIHTFGFTGGRNRDTGALPSSNTQSVFDSFVQIQNGKPYFTGTTAKLVLGQQVPLEGLTSSSAIYHTDGKALPALANDVMNAFASLTEKTTDLDLAILKDLGYSLKKTLTSVDGHTFIPGEGGQAVTGTNGADTAVLFAKRGDYALSRSGASVVATSKADATDVVNLSGIETLKFSDFTVDTTVSGKAKSIAATDLNALIELYVAYFNRIPDGSGMAYWIDARAAGASITQIGESFYAAAIQYSTLTGYSADMTNGDFVKVVYKNVLGRDTVDAEGYAYWTSSLANGTETRGSLINTILGSAHNFKGNAEWGRVADLLDNKLAVGKQFAIDQGLGYATPDDTISKSMAIAQAVTAIDTKAAVALIGVADTGWAM
ncbi:DUF4214 domain-containing protein [Herbaspirillum sp. HC18]|nr:DUF4214 domain-containing protein [Herbaspirillum sp. HC18]